MCGGHPPHLALSWLACLAIASTGTHYLVHGQQMHMSKSLPDAAQLPSRPISEIYVPPQSGATQAQRQVEVVPASRFETYQHYFALCTVTKDSPGDLREWVDYHHALGVTKFYIFDTDQRIPNGPILEVRTSNPTSNAIGSESWYSRRCRAGLRRAAVPATSVRSCCTKYLSR